MATTLCGRGRPSKSRLERKAGARSSKWPQTMCGFSIHEQWGAFKVLTRKRLLNNGLKSFSWEEVNNEEFQGQCMEVSA